MFLTVSKLNEHHNENNDLEFAVEASQVTGGMYYVYHLVALLIKRMRYYSRDTFGIACEVLLPILCVVIGLVMRDISATFSQDQRPI